MPISNFAQIVTTTRRQRGITQSQLATRIDCNQSAISMFERGNTHALSREKIEALAEELELSAPPEIELHTEDSGYRFCPVPDCPANHMITVQNKAIALPHNEIHLTGQYCRFCGEILESTCPGCHRPAQPGAFCSFCGTPYIPTA